MIFDHNLVRITAKHDFLYNSNLFVNSAEQEDFIGSLSTGFTWSRKSDLFIELGAGVTLNRYMKNDLQNSEDYYLTGKLSYPYTPELGLHSISLNTDISEYSTENSFLGNQSRFFQKSLNLEYHYHPNRLHLFGFGFKANIKEALNNTSLSNESYRYQFSYTRNQSKKLRLSLETGFNEYSTSNGSFVQHDQIYLEPSVRYLLPRDWSLNTSGMFTIMTFRDRLSTDRNFQFVPRVGIMKDLSKATKLRVDTVWNESYPSDSVVQLRKQLAVSLEHRLPGDILLSPKVSLSNVSFNDSMGAVREDRLIQLELSLLNELDYDRELRFYIINVLSDSSLDSSTYNQSKVGGSISQLF